ncbi:mesothelin [Pantherophis guttatus]|uniref:Mesothelin n=1 Tax=Pantherophis guttatus TaxID=94885 RepID=A0A6P9CB22_PANGU|nr:mesothelin [Pantherophis guttatus]
MPESPRMLCCLFMAGCAIMLTPSDALKSLNTSGLVTSKEEARISNHLVCEMSGDSIAVTGEKLLKQLSQCQHLTPDQTKAIQQIFSGGNTSFGPPSTWTSSVLDQLGQLILIPDTRILQSIPQNVLKPWLQNFILHSDLPQNQLVRIREILKSSRTKREIENCPEDKMIREDILNDDLIDELLLYTPAHLKLCLTKGNLVNNISAFSDYPFTDEQLTAVKDKLDEIFPKGYPPAVFSNLGLLEKRIDTENIKQWTINSSSTVHALLNSVSSDELRIAVIQRYIESRVQIDSDFLNVLGPYICLLNEDQLSMITERTIGMATLLDPSNCSSAVKDHLYPKAKRAFSDRHYEYSEYYKRIRPFLGGAPGEDLRALSKNDVNMDIQTFLGLKSSSLKELTPEIVKGLLGTNLNDLRDNQNIPLVREWIQKQKQSDLNSLGLGLRGGLPEGFIILTRPKKQD